MGHWYDKDGNPQYTIKGKNGKKRDTTLRDARKEGYVPSVTTIISQLSKPGLDIWKLNKLLDACWAHEGGRFLDYQHYKDVIMSYYNNDLNEAPRIGTEIHDDLEKYFSNSKSEKYQQLCKNVLDKVNDVLGDYNKYISEQSFYSNYGFGGKIDLYTHSHLRSGAVIDFKTKNSDDRKKMIKSFDYAMQLAAYRKGLTLDHARCFNVYISTMDFSMIEIVEYTEEELNDAWKSFKCLLKVWQTINGIKPEVDYVI